MKKEVYKEIFISPLEWDNEEKAKRALETIRVAHPSENGWKEIRGEVVKLSNGKYIAVREHVRYLV